MNKKLKLGIWIHNTSPRLMGEGINMLLAFLVRNANKNDDLKITIACLSWMKKPIIDFFEEMHIDTSNINFIVSHKRVPYIYRLRNFKEKKKKKKKDYSNILIKLRKLGKNIFKDLAGTNNIILLALKAIIMSPFLILGIFILILIYIGKWIKNLEFTKKVKDKILTVNNKISDKLFNTARRLYENMQENEFDRLASKCKSNKNVDLWFLSYPSNTYIKYFKKPVVVSVPDMVYLDFPIEFLTLFGKRSLGKIHYDIAETIGNATATISYSHYVAENHAKRFFKGNNNMVKVINHANVDTINELEKLKVRTNMEYLDLSNRLIQNYIRKKTKYKDDNMSNYLSGVSWENVQYIFVSSQVRPHKNYLNIFKAFEKVLREDYKNIKLIITGTPDVLEETQKFIKERKLYYDILPITAIPPRVHAAFYCKASLTVVPTLFEGGFPFCFSESLSVNTPAIMSDIPVTSEMIQDDEMKKDMLFNPYDVNEIRKKINWALDNSEILLEKQKVIFNNMKKRTWDIVANEYINCFEEVSQNVKNKL